MVKNLRLYDGIKRHIIAPLLLITTMLVTGAEASQSRPLTVVTKLPTSIESTLLPEEKSISTPDHESDNGPIDLKGYNKLMIVAHADDEILWGGAHLLSDNYYVVCVSSGDKKGRVEEFTNAMSSTGDKCTMLNFSVYNKKGNIDSWNNESPEIYDQLKPIVELKKWDYIVTHNVEGEYGNSQHRVVNRVVTSLAMENDTTLYYFGDYFKKGQKTKQVPNVDEYTVQKKRAIIAKDYPSKDYSVMRQHRQMLAYENWTLGYQSTAIKAIDDNDIEGISGKALN